MAEIVYLDDIAKELAEEFGMSEDEAYELCKLNIDHVYELMRKPGVVSIRFPNLGVMYLNMKKVKYAKVFKEYREMLLAKLEILEEMYAEQKDLAHARNSYYSILRKYFYAKIDERIKAPLREVLKKIENKQNG